MFRLRTGGACLDFSLTLAWWCSSKRNGSCVVITSTLGEFATIHTSGPEVPKVVLKKGKVQIFKTGNPMVYTGAVDRIIGRPPPVSGDMVLVTDGALHPIAWGVYNSVSMFSVRIMQMEDEVARDSSCLLNMEKLLNMRINDAVNLRNRLGLPVASTDVYRLVNSEGDRLSGLTVDIFGKCAVVASSAAWVEKCRLAIEKVVRDIVGCQHIFWRQSIDMLREEGINLADHEKTPSGFSESDTSLQVMENGICYKVSLEGQKTGFYADQRDNRLWLQSIAKNRTVLDLCCYSGGFALNAAKAGASKVTGVDSSLPALELANANRELNKLDANTISFVKADISDFMKKAISEGKTWDIVILDPPKLAPNRKALQRAAGMYRSLNSLAMQCTKRGGLLMTCSCSGAMTQSGSFVEVLQGSAASAKRKITQLRYSGAAPDHTLDPAYPEGMYLSNILLNVY